MLYFQALKLAFFSQQPPPTPHEKLPLPASCASNLAKGLQEAKAGMKRKREKELEAGMYSKNPFVITLLFGSLIPYPTSALSDHFPKLDVNQCCSF